MANGNVYYFNSTPNTMLLLLNNSILNASLTGVAQTTSYVPAYGSAARNPATESNNATFGQNNTLVVSFPGGGSQTYAVDIDPNQVQLTNDIQLYIFFNEVVIVTPGGQGNQSGQSGGQQTAVKGEALSSEQEDALVKAKADGADAS